MSDKSSSRSCGSIIFCCCVIVASVLAILFLAEPIFSVSGQVAGAINSLSWTTGAARVLVVVSIVLTISGALGGLAYHVGRIGFQWPQPNAPKEGKRTWDLGFIGDAFLGVVAANALHFPLAAMVNYDSFSNSTSSAKAWLALVALGILGGYAGGVLLKRWSDSLVATMAKDIEENKRLVATALEQNEQLREQKRMDEDRILFRAVDEAVTTQRELDMTAAALLERRAKQAFEVKAKGGLQALGAVDSVFAAYSAYRDKRYGDSTELLNHAVKQGLDKEFIWAAENLLGLSYHYQIKDLPDWFEKAKATYESALLRNPGVIQAAILTVNFGYLLLDHNDIEPAIQKFDSVRGQKLDLEKRPRILDVARLGAAIAHTAKYLKNGADKAEERNKAEQAISDIQNPSSLRYLFLDGSVSSDVIQEWKNADWDKFTSFKPLLV